MVFCHTRITHEDDEVLSAILLWCRSNSKVHLCVKEVSKIDKKHIHMLHDTIKTISSFGTNLRKQFPFLKGNGSHASQEFKKSLDDNILYCCKGTKENSPVVLFTILDQVVIDNAHKKYWEDQQKFLIEKGVTPEDKKKKNISMIERIIQEIPQELARSYVSLQAEYKPSDYEVNELYKVKEEIMETVIGCFGKYAKMCDDRIITNHINGTLIRLVTIYGNSDEVKVFKTRLLNRVRQNTF